MSKPEAAISRIETAIPPVPLSPEATQLDYGFLADLTLKTVYADANCTTERAAQKLKLSMPVTENLLQHLYREKFVEIRGLVSYGNNRYGLLDRGWQRAQQLLDMNTVKWCCARARRAIRFVPRQYVRLCPDLSCLRAPYKRSG